MELLKQKEKIHFDSFFKKIGNEMDENVFELLTNIIIIFTFDVINFRVKFQIQFFFECSFFEF